MADATCDELSFDLDSGLAAGYTCEVVPQVLVGEADNPILMTTPEYVQATLQSYSLDRPAVIRVVRIADYVELRPDYVPARVAQLQSLVVGGIGFLRPVEDKYDVPVLFAGFAWSFVSQVKVIPVDNGGGVRFLTEFHFGEIEPVGNDELMYTFVGLTEDGKFWIEASLPITQLTLSEGGMDPGLGWTWEQMAHDSDTYFEDLSQHLNAQPSNSFTPTIDALDALVASITITP